MMQGALSSIIASILCARPPMNFFHPGPWSTACFRKSRRASRLLIEFFYHDFGDQSSGSEGAGFASQSRDLQLDVIR